MMDPEWVKTFEFGILVTAASLPVVVYNLTLAHYLKEFSKGLEKSLNLKYVTSPDGTTVAVDEEWEKRHLDGLKWQLLHDFETRRFSGEDKLCAVPVYIRGYADGYDGLSGGHDNAIVWEEISGYKFPFVKIYDWAFKMGQIAKESERTEGRHDARQLGNLEQLLRNHAAGSA